VHFGDAFTENMDPKVGVELQRGVDLLDQELVKWSNDLPGMQYVVILFA
jgi:hypothetical protein